MPYTPTITIAGVDRTSWVRVNPSLLIDDTRNETPATCSFTVDTPIGWLPAQGDAVTAVLNGRTLFTGVIVTITQTYEGLHTHVLYQLACTDYGRLADAELVWGSYDDVSASTIAAALVPTGFTGTAIEAGLDNVSLAFSGEKRSAALTRLAEAAGATWYWATKDLHFFATTPETGVEQPDALTQAAGSLLHGTLTITTDDSQIATRVYVEGPTTTTLVPLKASDTLMPVAGFNARTLSSGRVVADMSGFDPAGGTIRVTHPYTGEVIEMTYTGVEDHGDAWTLGCAQVNSTTFSVDDTSIFRDGGGWLFSGGIYVQYGDIGVQQVTGIVWDYISVPSGIQVTDEANYIATASFIAEHDFSVGDWVSITGFTPSGYNGLRQVETAADRYHITFYIDDPSLADAPQAGNIRRYGNISTAIGSYPLPDAGVWPCFMLTGLSGAVSLPAGSSVRAITVRNDTAAQATLAATDGSSGIREERISPETEMTGGETITRGDAELLIRSTAETRLSYVTTDPKTRAGTTVSVSLYTPSFVQEIATDAPRSWWKFGETVGTTVTDSGSAPHDLAYTGTHTLDHDGLCADGRHCVELPGLANYAWCAHSADFNFGSAAFTIEAMCWPTSRAGWLLWHGAAASGATTGWGVGLVASGVVFRAGDGTRYLAAGGVPISTTAPSHVAAVFDRTNRVALVYVNGVLGSSEDISLMGSTNATSQLWAGGWFPGLLQDVAIYNTALSATRIAAHAAARLLPPPVTGDFKIQKVTMTDFGRGDNMPPTYRVQASNKRFTAMNLWSRLKKSAT